jgi:hypothetical protein
VSLRNVNNRLSKLEGQTAGCPETIIIRNRAEGIDALPPALPGPDPAPCPKCGSHHVTEILEIVVKTRADLERLDALGYGDWKASGGKG